MWFRARLMVKIPWSILDPARQKLAAMSLTPAACWRSGNVVGRINEVTLRRARLVLGWVTVFSGQTTSIFHQVTQANSASDPQRDGK